MADACCVICKNRALIRLTGEDIRAFLQGLISNDVEKIAPDRAIYAAFLTAQGKFLHDFLVAEMEGAIYLDCEALRRDDLLKRLSLYKLRSQVTLEAADDMAVVVIYGPDAIPALELDAERGAARAFAGGVAYTDPRLAEMGVRAILPPANIAEAFAGERFEAGTGADYESLRLGLGLPDGSRDLVVEKSILLESGFDELDGVDWDKGCFLGQELTARTKYRGLVKKRLMPVAIDGPAPAPGAALLFNGKDAGEMRSAQGERGIALVRLEAFEQSKDTGQPFEAGTAKITPEKPGWAIF